MASSTRDVFDVVPGNPLESDPLSPGRVGCVSINCLCGTGEEDDNGKKWEVLWTILLASGQNGVSSNQHVRYTQDKSCCIWIQVAGVSHHPAESNELVRC